MGTVRSKHAFTVVEILVCLAIIVTIAAIALPATVNSKRAANITADKAKLHQCQIAVALYQQDNAELSQYVAGLPSYMDILGTYKKGANFYGAQHSDWDSACGWPPTSDSPSFVLFSGPEADIGDYFTQRGSMAVVLADANCNTADVDLRADFVEKLGLAVTVGGSILTKRHTGEVYSPKFW